MRQEDDDCEDVTGAGPSTSADNAYVEITEEDDGSCITAQDLAKLTSYILQHSKQLELIAAEFVQVFNMRCQLTVGNALIHIREVLTSVMRKENKQFLMCRIICIYLIYRVRDIEPWLIGRTGKSEDMAGHIFLEYFLELAEESINGTDDNGVTTHTIEKKIAKILLASRSVEINKMTAEYAYSFFSDESHTVEDSADQKALAEEFQSRCKYWPNDVNTSSTAFSYPLRFHSSKESTNELSLEEILTVLVGMQERGGTSPFIISPLKTVPVGMEIGSKSKRNRGHIEISNLENGILEEDTLSDHVSSVFYDDSLSPDPSKAKFQEENDLNTFILDIIPRIIKGETLPSGQLTRVYECVKHFEDDHPFFVKIADFPPLSVNAYIEQHTKFSSELIYRIVKNDHNKIYLFLLAMMEMGFSVQCVEIVLRLYRSIPSLPTDILLEYCNTLMNICDATTSSSQKARYVRMFSSFVITILNDGLLQEQVTDNAKSCFHQIQAFALRNNEYKEATGLYQKIQEVLRKWSN